MPFGSPTAPIKPNWTILYLNKENKEAEEIKTLVHEWCVQKRRTCQVVLLGENREPPITVKNFPCLRTSSEFHQGSKKIKSFIQEDLKAAS